MEALNRKIMLLVLFIVLSSIFVRTVFAQIGYPDFREGDILYIQASWENWYPGHNGILYKEGTTWRVRESRLWDYGVVDRTFTSFYGRYVTQSNPQSVTLLKVNSDDFRAILAADWAVRTNGTYRYPGNHLFGQYSCSSFVFWAYFYGAGIDIRDPSDPPIQEFILPGDIYYSPIIRDRLDIQIGDLNFDISVNIRDLQGCVNHILATQNWSRADANGDGAVNVLDVQTIVNIILCK